MHSPGESLKQEREARGRTIDEMAEATGIRPHLLAALEQGAFDALPGRGFGKLYIRAYAEILGFDPRPVIEAYDQTVRGREAAGTGSEAATAPRPVKAMLARWRQERMAARAEAAVPEVEARPEAPATIEAAAEAEPEPVAIEPEPVAAEPEPVAMEPGPVVAEQQTAPEVSEEPAVQTVALPTDPIGEFIEEAPALPLPMESVSPARPARSRRWLVASLLVLALLPLMAYLVFMRSTPDPLPVAARHEAVPGETVAPPPTRPPPLRVAEPPSVLPHAQTPVREPATSSSLRVAESAVGLRLVGTSLEGEGDRFHAGQRVTFATRVLGGGAGDSIRHVWLRDGKVEQSIRLRLGGTSWRTFSTKTLGRPGAWAVEARDEQGRVLARADLSVVP